MISDVDFARILRHLWISDIVRNHPRMHHSLVDNITIRRAEVLFNDLSDEELMKYFTRMFVKYPNSKEFAMFVVEKDLNRNR